MKSKSQTLITGSYRSGTEYITHLINSHPSISASMYQINIMRFAYKKVTRGISFYELLTMASIVEKEDAFDTHANVIASVFWNRLKNNDRFSSCVTVEYILGYHRPFLLF